MLRSCAGVVHSRMQRKINNRSREDFSQVITITRHDFNASGRSLLHRKGNENEPRRNRHENDDDLPLLTDSILPHWSAKGGHMFRSRPVTRAPPCIHDARFPIGRSVRAHIEDLLERPHLVYFPCLHIPTVKMSCRSEELPVENEKALVIWLMVLWYVS